VIGAVKALRFPADGDTVVVLSNVTVGGEAGQGAEVFTLRDGKTVRAQLYEDTRWLGETIVSRWQAGRIRLGSRVSWVVFAESPMERATAGVRAVSPAGWRVDDGIAWDD
jgi:hypothetical protein